MINKTKEETKMKAETKKEFDALVKYVNTIDKCGETLDTNIVIY